ncbi:MAG: SufBD protein [Anaerocolumna sp.]
MITADTILSIEKDNLKEASIKTSHDDLPQLVEWLSEKNDKIRYKALLLLQCRSQYFDDVYTFWDFFCDKLKNDNSYQRSVGIILIAENAKWDTANKMDNIIADYLMLLNDKKPITVRQCIQALNKIIIYKPHLCPNIADGLMSVNMQELKETMRKLILMDILNVLIAINKIKKTNEIENYIIKAITGGILDNKSKKQIEAIL